MSKATSAVTSCANAASSPPASSPNASSRGCAGCGASGYSTASIPALNPWYATESKRTSAAERRSRQSHHQRHDQQRDDVDYLDERVDSRAGSVLVRISHSIPGDRGLV